MKDKVMYVPVSEDAYFEEFTSQVSISPERLVMAAVLERAFRDLKAHGDDIKHRMTAIEWFLDEDTKYVFSFKNIKAHISICPNIKKSIARALAKAIEETNFEKLN